MTETLMMFGREHRYSDTYTVDNDLRVLAEFERTLGESHIIDYGDPMDPMRFHIHDDHFICSDAIRELVKQAREKANATPDNSDWLLSCCDEDEEWTRQRNEGLTGIFYRKVTLKPDARNLIAGQIGEYRDALGRIKTSIVEDVERRKAETERLRAQWERTKTHRYTRPSGGEQGRDGYIDADYRSQNGTVIRMVSRDVFDVGCYSYPKRVEGTDGVMDRTDWTEDEKNLTQWLSKFGPFHGIRM